jgi:hypothetical protein
MLKDFLPRYPPLRLDHLERLTDSVGILQHATHSVPDPRHGYSIDDQARALIATLQHANLAGNRHAPKSAYIYMSYLRFAATFDGGFHNFLSFSRTWIDEKGSEDAHGRAMWALGYATRFGIDGGLAAAAAQLFDDGTTLLEQLSWSRAWAFSLFGLYHRLKAEPSGKLLRIAGTLADRLVEQFDRTAATGWQWFDDELTYCNA